MHKNYSESLCSEICYERRYEMQGSVTVQSSVTLKCGLSPQNGKNKTKTNSWTLLTNTESS